jgi:predicted transposase/invertase (TIGR01784 family)
MADTERFTERLIHLSPEHKEKMMTIAEQLQQIGWKKGREEGEAIGEARGEAIGEARGEAIGEARGEAKARLSLARNLLNMNFPVEKIVEATGLPLEEIQSLRAH